MFPLILIYMLRVSHCLSSAVVNKSEKCTCYDICDKNFTTNSIKDVQKITACERGCRFYNLAFHTSHDISPAETYNHAKEGCLTSCSESYSNLFEISACKFGCSAVEASKTLCNTVESQIPQISFSFLVKESDVLIHPGEPEPDDSLTDPGLRKQIQKTLAALLEVTPRIPEIRFRNLPIRSEKFPQFSHSPYKCPKFYGFDSKLEFRNGKIIIGDLYLFVAVFVFVAICFIAGHHIENRRLTRKAKERGTEECRPFIKVDLERNLDEEYENEKGITIKEPLPDYESENVDKIEAKFESITLVFHDDTLSKDSQNGEKNNIKI